MLLLVLCVESTPLIEHQWNATYVHFPSYQVLM